MKFAEALLRVPIIGDVITVFAVIAFVVAFLIALDPRRS